MDTQYAMIGNMSQIVKTPPMIDATSVLDAPPPFMECKLVLERRRLRSHERYPHLAEDLHQGFWLEFPTKSVTQSPLNKNSISTYTHEFLSIIKSEIQKERYIGPFQSSPFSIIPKPGKPGCFRIIQDYSFLHTIFHKFPNPSINSYINSD